MRKLEVRHLGNCYQGTAAELNEKRNTDIYLEGPPKETKYYSVAQLKACGLVGLYRRIERKRT